jgi:sulfoquinovosidase
MRLLLAALAATLALPATAPAAEPLVVDADGAQAVIELAPFGVSFRDADTGRTVLRQAPGGARPAPGVALMPVRQGGSEVAGTSSYQPLGFQVGGQAKAGSAFIHAGNILAGAQAGTVFSPQAVKQADPVEGGYRLVLTTSSPATDLVLRITRDRGRAIRVQAEPTHPAAVAAMSDSFVAGEDEAFRGFGGQRDAIDQRGRTHYAWTEQEGSARLAYYPQASFVSSEGYGFLLNQTELSTWRMASDDPSRWQVDVQAKEIDYTVAVGSPRQAIRTLTAITGVNVLPPEWAHGLTLSQPQIVGGDSLEAYKARVAADVERLARRETPVKAYAYESWRGMGDELARETNAKLRALGIRPIGYVRPFVFADEFFNTQGDYDEVYGEGLATRTAAGTPYQQHGTFGFPTLNLDFTNPDTQRWWKRHVRRMLDLGFDGFMQDFGEEISPDQHFRDGSTGETMHNAYPTIYHRLTREIVDEYERETGREVYFYTRAGFSGRPGSAAYENGTFPGDESASWTRLGGLPTILPDMLSRAIGGVVGYNTDIGGYVDVGRGAPTIPDQYDFGNATDKELFLRWTQAAVFTPYFRVHNNQASGVKYPWSFDEEALQNFAAMADLHHRITPLIRRLWRDFERTGVPPTAPMWLMDSSPEARGLDDQFMVGDDVLVAPVIEQGARRRSVWFPEGCWRHGETGERFEGGRRATVAAPLTSLPWFERCTGRAAGR